VPVGEFREKAFAGGGQLGERGFFNPYGSGWFEVPRSRVESLQVEALPHQALEAGFVEKIVGQLFVGKHGKCGAFGASG